MAIEYPALGNEPVLAPIILNGFLFKKLSNNKSVVFMLYGLPERVVIFTSSNAKTLLISGYRKAIVIKAATSAALPLFPSSKPVGSINEKDFKFKSFAIRFILCTNFSLSKPLVLARAAADAIFPFARTVSIADWSVLPNFNGKKGYDAGDFFEEDRPIDEIIELLDRAKDFVPLGKITEEIREDNEKRQKVHLAEDLKDIFYEETKSGVRLLQTKVSEFIKDEYQFCATEQGSKTVFFRYNEGVWEKISSRIIRKLILDLLFYDTTSYVIRSIIDLLADLTFIPSEKFNSRNDLIPLRNCVFDLSNFKPLKHSPDFYFTFKNDYDFDLMADCPHFDRALAEYSLNDAEWLTAFWEIAGYCLTGSYEIQKMFWFTGARGGNGKGTVTRVMQKLVGVELTKPNLSPSKLDGQFYKKALIGKRLAITGDLPPFMKNIDTIKELTGGDRQSTDVKFGDMEDFENTAKLVIAMNRMPTFAANEPIQPILRRVYLLPFDYQITRYDMDIEVRFESELSGIFNKAIAGLKRLRAQREFSNCSRGLRQLRIYSGSLNSFQEYMTEKLVFDREESVWLNDLWENYKGFMEEVAGQFWENKSEHITNRTLFQRELAARTGARIETVRAYNEIRGGTYPKYIGVGLQKRAVNAADAEDEKIWLEL